MKEVIIAPGTDYERKSVISKPKGRVAREMMPKVVKFMNRFSELNETAEDMVELLDRLWEADETGKSQFEDKIVPYVLNLDTIDGRTYLNENCTNTDILNAFAEAAQYLMSEMFNHPGVEEALKKSKDEAPEAQE